MTPMAERWDWEHANQAQRRAVAAMTPEERLRWLEEAQELALAAGALGRDRAGPSATAPSA